MATTLRFRCNSQLLAGRWIDAESLRVRLLHPPRPEILSLEQGDTLRGEEDNETVRVAIFIPTPGGLVRGGVVKTEYISRQTRDNHSTFHVQLYPGGPNRDQPKRNRRSARR